jgi:hypothetical protein
MQVITEIKIIFFIIWHRWKVSLWLEKKVYFSETYVTFKVNTADVTLLLLFSEQLKVKKNHSTLGAELD